MRLTTLALAAMVTCASQAHLCVMTLGGAGTRPQATERTVAVRPNVLVSLCVSRGDVVVRGWERPEVRARSRASEGIQLRRGGGSDALASRVEVIPLSRGGAEPEHHGDCHGGGGVELDVPRGAVVQVRAGDGRVSVSDVSEVRVETQGGEIVVRRASRAVEATSLGGNVSLSASTGRVRLRSSGGAVKVTNVRAASAGDDFEAKSVSGEVTLDRVGHPHVVAATVSGSLRVAGPLARGGEYALTTTSGDLTVELPAGASFRVDVKVADASKFVADFPLHVTHEVSGPAARHLTAKRGEGGATLNLASFSGTVRLRRRR